MVYDEFKVIRILVSPVTMYLTNMCKIKEFIDISNMQ